MTTNVLTQEFVFAALEAERNGDKFPIDLDDVWQFSGYTRKDTALEFLLKNTSLQRDVHFSGKHRKSPTGGRPSESIKMSVKGFRFFLAKSNTPKGDETLWHLLEIEDAYRDNLERQLKVSLQPSKKETETIAKLKKQLKTVNEALANWKKMCKEAIERGDFYHDLAADADHFSNKWADNGDNEDYKTEAQMYFAQCQELQKEVDERKEELRDIYHQIKNTMFEHQIKQNQGVKNTDKKIKPLKMRIEITTTGSLPCTYFQDVTVSADTLAKLSEEYRADIPNRTVKDFLNKLMSVKLMVNDVNVPWKLK